MPLLLWSSSTLRSNISFCSCAVSSMRRMISARFAAWRMLCNRPLTETSVAQSAASRMPTTIRSWVPVIDSPVSTVVWRHPSLRGCSSAIGVFFRAQQSKFVEVNLQACNRRRGYAGYPSGLPKAARSHPVQFFYHFMG